MSINLLVVGDLHISTTNPVNRIDDIKEAIRRKFKELYKIATENKVDAIICTADIFNNGQVSNTTLLFAYELLSECPVPFYTGIGNHDLFNYNIGTYDRTSLRILQTMLKTTEFDVFRSDDSKLRIEDKQGNVVNITFQEFTNELDSDEYNGYTDPNFVDNKDHINIRVVHGMLLNHKPPFDRYTLIDNVETNQDVVISGHDHTGYGVVVKNNTTFINPGSLLRLSASKAEIKRKIQVCLVTVKYLKVTTKLIPLRSAEPGSVVLSRDSIEKAKERTYAMDTFSTILKHGSVDFRVDILNVLDQVAKLKAEEKKVIDRARELILANLNNNNERS